MNDAKTPALRQFAEAVCAPSILKKDEGLTLVLDRSALYRSPSYQAFSRAVNALPGISKLAEARQNASNASHGDIARQIADEGIDYCWKRNCLNPDSIVRRFEEQIRLLETFKHKGHLPVPMAILLPIGIEESVKLPFGTLEPLSEATLRHFSSIIENGGVSWLDHGRGKAVFLTTGDFSYAELIEGNLSRGPDHKDNYGLLLLRLAIIIHCLQKDKHIPRIDPEMACQSGAISGGTGFSRNHARAQHKIAKDEMSEISRIVEILAAHEFPHFPARRFVEALIESRSQEDMLVDCVTGWEGLLMPGEKNELSFRLSLTLALLLDENGTGVTIPKQVTRIYGIRSAIVHGSFKNEPQESVTKKLKKEIDLRQACLDAVVLTKKLLRRLVDKPAIIGIGAEAISDEIGKRLFPQP